MKFIFDSGKPSKSGRINPDWVAGFNRNTRQVKTGIGGRIAPDSPTKEHNNANMISIGGRMVSMTDGIKIVDIWLDSECLLHTEIGQSCKVNSP